jgi:hypothetical protein
MTRKDHALYYNVKVYIKNLPLKNNFQIISNPLSIKNHYLHYVEIGYSILNKFISNLSKFSHNKLRFKNMICPSPKFDVCDFALHLSS